MNDKNKITVLYISKYINVTWFYMENLLDIARFGMLFYEILIIAYRPQVLTFDLLSKYGITALKYGLSVRFLS